MNGHASINRLYRLIWSDHLQGWIVAAENVRSHSKRSSVGSAARHGAGRTGTVSWSRTLVACGVALLAGVAVPTALPSSNTSIVCVWLPRWAASNEIL